MTRMVFSICVASALCACGGASKTSGPKKAVAGADDSGSPRAGNEVDALWALAPSDAVIGMVVAPGATLKLYDMAAEMLRVVEARPFGAALTQEARAKVSELPFDVFDPKQLASAGIDLGRGAALFLDPQEKVTMVLPVSDRVAFRSLTKATVSVVQGTDFDTFKGEFSCTEIQSLYVCMETPDELLAKRSASASAFAERVYRLPPSYRGDAELVMDLPAFEVMEGEQDEEFKELFSEYGLLAAVVQMGRGNVTARAWVQGKPRGDMQAIVEASSGVGSLSAQVAKMRPSTLARMIIPMQLVDKEIPEDQELPGGLSLKRDVLGNMTGEFVAYAPSSLEPWGRLAFGIKDPQGFRALLNMGCSMIPMLDFMTVKPGKNRCDFVIDYQKIPNLDESVRMFFDKPLNVGVAVEDSQVAITVGNESPLVTSSTPSEIGRELLEKEWSYSLWTQHFSIISGLEGSWSKVIGQQPKEMQEGMRFAVWLTSFVSEFATAISFQPDGMHMMAHIGTYAADPAEPYAAFQAAVTKNIDGGDAGAAFAEIRRQWPTSRAAQQSLVRSPFSELFAKLVAHVSLPAFVNYIEQSKAVQGGAFEVAPR